ncbi:hypothetical protein JIN85_07830 [Luteolibacter pohnpeiensis]|uniref:NfeD-like C-terminal domain-containing protein n=1 Tax=Luteolibacter pohnpeiensis TaxID=454153 RepID=A0A934VWB4_9BACT|nr:hypothetical protein [Luteolibacter pohnpeiensis]MBK1882319.1 hypothetical protein [Luteolibacter pohnpeiensis]
MLRRFLKELTEFRRSKIQRCFQSVRENLRVLPECVSLCPVKAHFTFLLALIFSLLALPGRAEPTTVPHTESGKAKVMVIPVHGEINWPTLYIVRSGLKDAIDQGIKTVVLDINTPGGAGDVTFEILKALDKYPGLTISYVDNEAGSAGALICAGTDEIHFAPDAVIGAAAPVLSGGQDLGETMRLKVVSFINAKVRAVTEGRGYRGEVLAAMIDKDKELKIDDEVIKEKGSLLSLTATEAMKTYGNPPETLLGAGISNNLAELLDQKFGHGNWTSTQLEITWSKELASFLQKITPVLLGLGLLLLFIEFKTPGFGIFGISGSVLIGVFFFAQFNAGLSGHEPALFFAIGVILLLVELFFLPGTAVCAILGVALMLGSLIWSMTDIWPQQLIALAPETFLWPLINVATGVLLAVVIFLLMLKFLPHQGPWGGMVLQAAVKGEPVHYIHPVDVEHPLVGKAGVAVTSLFPSGQVEVEGQRYEAKLAFGYADVGTPVIIKKQGEFSLVVEVMS